MENVTKQAFKVIGIKVRTSNKDMQAAKDIPELWNKFMSENIISKIPNKTDTSIFCIYTNYEKDHTEGYDTIIGCKVDSFEKVPEGMVTQEFNNSNYAKYISRGNLTKNVVYDSWVNIWNENLNRTFTADFEVYGEKAQDPTNAEVEIFVAVK